MILLTYQERKVLWFLSFLLVLGLAVVFFRKARQPGACRAEFSIQREPLRPLDINKATVDELIALPGIGEKTAQAIIALRAGQGGFKDIHELVQVKGISGKKLEKLKECLYVR